MRFGLLIVVIVTFNNYLQLHSDYLTQSGEEGQQLY